MAEMSITVMWGWLVTQGLYHDLVSAFILVPIMRVMMTSPLKRAAKAVEDIAHKAEELVTYLESKLAEMEDTREREANAHYLAKFRSEKNDR